MRGFLVFKTQKLDVAIRMEIFIPYGGHSGGLEAAVGEVNLQRLVEEERSGNGASRHTCLPCGLAVLHPAGLLEILRHASYRVNRAPEEIDLPVMIEVRREAEVV